MSSKVPQPSPNTGQPRPPVGAGDQVNNGRSGPSPGETAEHPAPVSPPPPPKKD